MSISLNKAFNLEKVEGSFGKNLISLPIKPYYPGASGLMDDIGDNCIAVNRWNSATQKSEGWIFEEGLGEFGVNFQLNEGEGYEVVVTQNTEWTLVGVAP